ncbi:hypothetical protein SAMN03003324_00132 [Pedobacter antarcticus]|nr:hypothetical protein [Pedobacter antarcticus]SFE33839.1 hypothetical protein SAMN03003324_00132 [Pedobacter antarcticus]
MISENSYEKLSWEKFEDMCVYLAQSIFDDPSFEQYLKRGSKQHGIDIITFDSKVGKNYTIQCKHIQSLSVNGLKKIVGEFEVGKYLSRTAVFVLSTTCELQTKELRDEIDLLKEYFLKEYNIDFRCWDRKFIDQELVKHYRIVHYFFGSEQAEGHCFLPSFSKGTVLPVEGFIERTVSSLDVEDDDPIWGRERREKSYSLYEIIVKNAHISKHICLLADAYEGKSMLMRQSAFLLSNSEIPFETISIDFKAFSIRPIADILNDHFGAWRSVPAKDLVILIDGLDEVPTDKFLDAITFLQEFLSKFYFINIIFSCRKLFYNYYGLKDKFVSVDFYQLNELNYFISQQYVDDNLTKKQSEDFSNKIDKLDVGELLRQPFYLVNLVKWFRTSPKNLPVDKIGIVTKFIEESLDVSYSRRLARGNVLLQKKVAYRTVLQKLAFSLQLSGLNSCDNDFIQQLFLEDEIELLQHSSLLSVVNGKWSFYNALFQEQLAAIALIDFEMSEIIKFVAVGKKIRKVRTKWIQTIASAISLLDEQSEKRKKLISLVENDNIELLTYGDSSKFTSAFRLYVLQSIIKKCVKLKIRLVKVGEKEIANFIGSEKNAVRYLLEVMSTETVYVVKVAIARILKLIHLEQEELELFEKLAINELQVLNDPYYGKILMDSLCHYSTDVKTLLPILFKRKNLLGQHEFRNGIYKLLLKNGLSEQYYDFGIEGFQVLVDYNRSISHHGSERKLEEFLLSTRHFESSKKLFQLMQTDSWTSFKGFRKDDIKNFVVKLEVQCSEIFMSNPMIVFSVVNFMEFLGRRSIKEEYRELNQFFSNTNTTLLAVKTLLLKNEQHNYWELADIISEECFEHVLWCLEEGYVVRNVVETFITRLRHDSRVKEADQLETMLFNAFGKTTAVRESIYEFYRDSEEIKFQNDLKFVQSQSAFREAVVAYFYGFGKKTIPSDSLYIDHADKKERYKTDSYILHNFLVRYCRDNEKVLLRDCLKIIDNSDHFEFVRAELILDYNFNERRKKEEQNLVRIAGQYFSDHVGSVNFSNTYFMEGQYLHWRIKEKLLGKLFVKFGLEVKDDQALDLLWLDKDGIKGVEHNRLNKRSSIAQILLERFSGNKAPLIERILKNMYDGISYVPVLGSHIGLCGHLKIHEAADFILEQVKSGIISNEDYSAIDIFLKLDGDKEKLLPLLRTFSNYEDYFFIHLVKLLHIDFQDEVGAILERGLSQHGLSIEKQIEFSKYLSSMGNRTGFTFLIGHMRKNKVSPYYTQSGFEIWNVDTTWGLDQIEDLLYLVVEEDNRDRRFYDTPKSFLVELIRGFAAKSEQDLLIVEQFINKNIRALKPKFEYANHLSWHLENALENFRNTEDGIMSVEKIKAIIY